jgi:hypothetical protein
MTDTITPPRLYTESEVLDRIHEKTRTVLERSVSFLVNDLDFELNEVQTFLKATGVDESLWPELVDRKTVTVYYTIPVECEAEIEVEYDPRDESLEEAVERALNDEISDYFVTSGVIAVEGDPTIHSFEENE